MATVILKNSSVAAKVPLPGDLSAGELAVNTADSKIYMKNSSNVIKAFSNLLEKTLNQPGDLTVLTGAARWYPSSDITVTGIRASVNTAPTGANVIVVVKLNGVTFSTVTITAGTNISSFVVPSPGDVLSTDYITVDVTQIGSTVAGADMIVQFNYERK